MLNIKKTLTKILDTLKLKETTATKYGDKWTSGNIQVAKRSGIVTVKCNGVAVSALSSRTQIANVPEGFRPYTETGALFDGSNVMWFVSVDGALKINATSATTFWGAMTYLGGGYFLTGFMSTFVRCLGRRWSYVEHEENAYQSIAEHQSAVTRWYVNHTEPKHWSEYRRERERINSERNGVHASLRLRLGCFLLECISNAVQGEYQRTESILFCEELHEFGRFNIDRRFRLVHKKRHGLTISERGWACA